MIGSLYTGSSGVKTQSNAMTVTGSNIANVNTIGFKNSRVNFQDLLSTSVGGGTGQKIGKGAQIANIQTMHTQGSFENTELETDLAIDGNGFFAVRDKLGRLFYTRAGQFTYDKEGYLTTKTGEYLQVKNVDPTTNKTIGKLEKVKLKGVIDPPTATGDGTKEGSGISIKANLDANAVPPQIEMDLENVTPAMYNFSTAVTVIDAKGNEHVVNVAFKKLPDQPQQFDPVTKQPIPGSARKNSWQWVALSPGEDIESGFPGTNKAIGGGFLQFSDDGRLITDTPAEIRIPPLNPTLPPGTQNLTPQLIALSKSADQPTSQVTFNFSGAGQPQSIGFKFGFGSNPNDPNDTRSGVDGFTQFASDSNIKNIQVDGFKAGTLENVSVDTDGTIKGYFDSGRVKSLGRVVLTDFNAREKLRQKGQNMFQKTFEAGEALVDEPGKGKMGKIHSKSLEHSNVELSSEFVKMIEGQRAFQANAKTVTTSDEILSDLIQMKR